MEKENMKEQIQRIGNDIRANVKAKAQKLNTNVKSYVCKNPWKSAMIAASIGLVLGYAARRRA